MKQNFVSRHLNNIAQPSKNDSKRALSSQLCVEVCVQGVWFGGGGSVAALAHHYTFQHMTLWLQPIRPILVFILC